MQALQLLSQQPAALGTEAGKRWLRGDPRKVRFLLCQKQTQEDREDRHTPLV